MRNLRASLNPWLGAAGLFFVAVSLFGVTYPATDAWHDQWRDYADQTHPGRPLLGRRQREPPRMRPR